MPTATTPRAVRGMVAISRNSNVKPLGFVCWFSVPDKDLKISRLRQHWVRGGLSDKPLPPAQKLVNAFRRAVRNQEGIVINEKDGTRTETDVRIFQDDSRRIEYHITRVKRDLNASRLVYQGAVRVWFDKRDEHDNIIEKMDHRLLGEAPPREAHEMVRAIEADFDAATETVPGSKVRTMVRHVLKDEPDDKTFGFGGENLRGKAGGIYFVWAKYEHDLERLSEVLDGLYPARDGQAYLHMIPLADGNWERELIAKHHEENSVDDLDEAIFDLQKLLREDDDSKVDGKVRKRAPRRNVIDHHKATIMKLEAHAASYADALDVELKAVGQRLDTAQRLLAKVTRLAA